MPVALLAESLERPGALSPKKLCPNAAPRGACALVGDYCSSDEDHQHFKLNTIFELSKMRQLLHRRSEVRLLCSKF